MEENLFNTEEEILEFLTSRSRPAEPGSDYAIASLVRFQYENDDVKARACAYLTTFLAEYPSSYDSLALRRHAVRAAPFLEAAGYVAALEPLMRVRNRFEAEIDDGYHHRPEWAVAVRNAIETLQRSDTRTQEDEDA